MTDILINIIIIVLIIMGSIISILSIIGFYWLAKDILYNINGRKPIIKD